METMIAIRDGIFWWVGNWVLFTALDFAAMMAWNWYHEKQVTQAEKVMLEQLKGLHFVQPDISADSRLVETEEPHDAPPADN